MGAFKPFLMGTMHAQLVGSARLGIEGDAEMGAVDALQDFILRDGLLALLMIHYLAGAVQIIGQQRKGNDSLSESSFSESLFSEFRVFPKFFDFSEMMAMYFFCTRWFRNSFCRR